MKASVKIARVQGIDIKIHWTFLILFVWVIYTGVKSNQSTQQILFTIAFVLVLFLCVTLHELGHALMAKRFNIETLGITLLPIGGVASMKRIPEDPRQELLVAAAGPLVNVVIAILLGIYVAIAFSTKLNEQSLTELINQPLSFHTFLFNILAANILLVVFNLIPAFPMDGGRMLRALLSFKMDRLLATKIAARTGQAFAMIFVFIGLFSNPFLIFIGVFVYLGAMGENSMVQTSGLLKGYSVNDVMRTDFTVVPTDATIKDAVGMLISGSDHDFLVVDEQQKVAGVLNRQKLFKAIREKMENRSVTEIMDVDFKSLQSSDLLEKIFSDNMQMRFQMMPVYEDKQLVGVLDKDNLSEFIIIANARHMK